MERRRVEFIDVTELLIQSAAVLVLGCPSVSFRQWQLFIMDLNTTSAGVYRRFMWRYPSRTTTTRDGHCHGDCARLVR
eukprot:3028157-Amphidinium_carterae.1